MNDRTLHVRKYFAIGPFKRKGHFWCAFLGFQGNMPIKVHVVIEITQVVCFKTVNKTSKILHKFSFCHLVFHMRAAEINTKENQGVA